MKTKLDYALSGAVLLIASASLALAAGNIIPPPPKPILSVSTVSPSGDQNPYGVAFVPDGFPTDGILRPGDVLVSNFNASSNIQGTGTTIMQIKQSGAPASVFYQAPKGFGLTTALGVLKSGFVIVGDVPTTDGTCKTIRQGSLVIVNAHGKAVATLGDNKLLDGPWDLTINNEGSFAQVFVSNVLSGTVTRINLAISETGQITVESLTQIASGYGTACNAAAVVVGPTGLAFNSFLDILYVASTGDNEIFEVPDAGASGGDHGTGMVIYHDNVHLHGPLALALAPNGDLITANGDAINEDPKQLSEIVEFTPWGDFVSQFQIDPALGSAFGLAVTVQSKHILFAAVDDNTSVLEEWQEPE